MLVFSFPIQQYILLSNDIVISDKTMNILSTEVTIAKDNYAYEIFLNLNRNTNLADTYAPILNIVGL